MADMSNSPAILVAQLINDWHYTLGCCGTYYEGHIPPFLFISAFLIYKKMCNVFEIEQLRNQELYGEDVDFYPPEELYSFPIPKAYQWDMFRQTSDKEQFLCKAVSYINSQVSSMRYEWKQLLPEYHFYDRRPYHWADTILSKWIERMDTNENNIDQLIEATNLYYERWGKHLG